MVARVCSTRVAARARSKSDAAPSFSCCSVICQVWVTRSSERLAVGDLLGVGAGVGVGAGGLGRDGDAHDVLGGGDGLQRPARAASMARRIRPNRSTS